MEGRKFYTVIHCIDPYVKQGIGHALRNTSIAIDNGADGVFLVGQRMHYKLLSYIYENVRKQFPKVWIGVNFLDISHEWNMLVYVAKKYENLNALWIDGMPDERLPLSAMQVFGGVAPRLDGKALSDACNQVVRCVDVVTMSGGKLGSAPSVEKLEILKCHLGWRIPLALVSGVSSNNIHKFGAADIFFADSSICKKSPKMGNEEYFVPKKVRELADLIHG